MSSFLLLFFPKCFFKQHIFLVLSALILFNSPVFSQKYTGEKFHNAPVFINKLDSHGHVKCEVTTPDETLQYSQLKPGAFNYTVVPSLNPQSLRGLKILLRATDQLLENKEALLSFRRAAARWERYIRSDITVVIDVDYGETRWGAVWGANVLGSTSSALNIINNAGVDGSVQILKSLHQGDSQLQDLYSAIPIPTPSTAGANLQTLVGGVIPMVLWGVTFDFDPSNPDLNETPFGDVPSIGFNSAFVFDFDPSDGITPGQIDFDAVVTHEIGHALGFTSIIGIGGPPNNWFEPWDLFRVRPEAVEEGSLTGFSTAQRVVTPGPPPADVLEVVNGVTYYKANQVVFDGIKKLEVSTATGARVGGDNQQASHWREASYRLPSLGVERTIGIMNPTLGSGRDTIRVNDLRALEVMGYDIEYNQNYSKILIVASGDTLDLDKYSDTLNVGDIPLNTVGELQFEIINLDLDNVLDYESEIIVEFSFPAGNNVNVALDNPEGSIAGGLSTLVKMMVTNTAEAAHYFGVLRLHTNEEDRLVVELPFEFSIGGAKAPTIILSENNLGNFEFSTEQGSQPISKIFNLSNGGTLDLNYRLVPSLSTRSNTPVAGLGKNRASDNSNSGSVLSKFLSPDLFKQSTVLYQNDFETGWGGFTASGDKSEDWQRFTSGSATLDGHSKPTAAYFGFNYGDSLKYRNFADARIVSSGFDFSSIPPQDKVVLTFNYYLQAEVGYDFASVLVSIDNGNTFEEVATSNNGILHNTDAWESVMIELPNLSGNPDSVFFAFRITTDELIEEEGWYIDDIEISTVEGANLVYTIPRSGTIAGPDDLEEITVTINGEQLAVGYYTGSVTIFSNDPRSPQTDVIFGVKNFLISNAEKNTLYASTARGIGSKGRVLTVNLETGAGTELGLSGFEPLKGITINPINDEMYAFVKTIADPTSKFVRINSADGFGLSIFESALDFNASAFDNDGTLFMTTTAKKLYNINPANGDSTFVANLGINVAALAVDPTTGDMWASVDETSENDRIYKIDKSNGTITLVGRTGLNRKTRALAFGPEDKLYGAVGEETQISSLIEINKTSAAAAEIGSIGYRGIFGLAFRYDPSVSVDDIAELIPNKFVLSQNYPNPFNPSTTIKFGIPENANVKLSVYNLIGEEVASLINNNLSAGYHSLEWNAVTSGRYLSSGIYFYSIKATGVSGSKFISTKKMVLLK